jgi:putative ABC transport system permease protein
VISYGLWQRGFGGDAGAIGKNVQFDGQKCGSHYLYLLGRLKEGVTLEQARQEMGALVARWGETFSEKNHPFHPERHPVVMYEFQSEVVSGVKLAMLTLLGAVVFVLLIACVNVANLLLARAEARQREIAIRKALGAGMSRLARQFITEGVLLATGGALLGLALALGGLRLILATDAGSIPRAGEIGLNWTILLFTLAVSFITGVSFGVAPLAQIAAGNLHDTLKAAASRTTGTVGANRFRRALVVGELSLALVLLIGTGLMIRAFWKLQEVHIGIDPENVLTMRVALPDAVYASERVVQFWEGVEQRVSSLPGTVSASFMSGLPPERRVNANDTDIEGFVRRPGGPIENISTITSWWATGILKRCGFR